MEEKKEQLRSFAKSIGFDLIGFTEATPLIREKTFFKKWLRNKFQADMKYMENNKEKRFDPSKILPNAKTVICLAVNYYNPSSSTFLARGNAPLEKRRAEDSKGMETEHEEAPVGKIANYAFGRDYHKVLPKKLKQLSNFLKQLFPNAQTKYYADTGPIAERAYAAKAGLGFIGKNSCLITREFGSWVFLSEIITDIPIPPDPPSKWKGSCGTCTRCLDACPTKAIIAPHTLDARRCISYLTIENKGPIPSSFKQKTHNYIFGCDICQIVCPHNIRQKPTKIKDFQRPIAGSHISKTKILNIKTDEEYLKQFAGSPLMRAKRKGLQRNVMALQ